MMDKEFNDLINGLTDTFKKHLKDAVRVKMQQGYDAKDIIGEYKSDLKRKGKNISLNFEVNVVTEIEADDK